MREINQREIKFRGWEIENKTMVPMSLVLFRYWFECPEDVVLMQHTGLKDKNGVEIYEGDILQHESIDTLREIVKWEGEMWTEEGFMTGFGEWFGTGNQYTIIGNIYENPELLENDGTFTAEELVRVSPDGKLKKRR